MYDTLKEKQVDDAILKNSEINKNAKYGCGCGTKKHSEFTKFSDAILVDTTYRGTRYYDIIVEYCPACGYLFNVEDD